MHRRLFYLKYQRCHDCERTSSSAFASVLPLRKIELRTCLPRYRRKGMPYGMCFHVLLFETRLMLGSSVRLGNSGLKVSRIILGCMSYGTPEWEKWVLGEEESLKIIKAAYVCPFAYLGCILNHRHQIATMPGSILLTQQMYVLCRVICRMIAR